MKKVVVGFIALFSLLSFNSSAQDCLTGEDSVKVMQDLSIFSTYFSNGERLYKAGNKEEAYNTFESARKAFFNVFEKAPGCKSATLINGPKLIKYYIEMAEAKEQPTDGLIDTLLMAYDLRIQYFGDEGKVLMYKGVDMSKYRKKEYQAAYETLKKAVEIQGNASTASGIQYYIKNLMVLVKKGEKTCDDAISAFIQVSDIIQANRDKKGYEKAEKNILKMVGSCLDPENLIPLYYNNFETNKENIAWLKMAKYLMDKKKCRDVEDEALRAQADEVYQNIIEAIHAIEPSFASSIALGEVYIDKDPAKSQAYIDQAQELAETDEDKIKIHNTLAKVYFTKKQYSKCRAEARKALAIKENYESYSWIAEAYAASQPVCGDCELQGKEVYWIAVDYLYKAKAVADSEEAKAHIQKRINKISTFFPKATDEIIFMKGVKEGDTVTVGCWIGESTKVRLRN